MTETMQALMEIKDMIHAGLYRVADKRLNSIYEAWTADELHMKDHEENFMIYLMSKLSRLMVK